MRDVVMVSQQELQGVAALGQGHHHFALAVAEMDVVVVGGNGLVGRTGLRVDQEMVMAGVGPFRARGGEAHLLEPHPDGEALGHAQPVQQKSAQ